MIFYFRFKINDARTVADSMSTGTFIDFQAPFSYLVPHT